MRVSSFVFFLVIGFIPASAHGAVIFDGTNSLISSNSITSVPNNGLAMGFVMPADSNYSLTNIELLLGGIADEGVESPSITVWSNDTVSPSTPVGTLLATLTLSGTLADGMNTFTSSGFPLDAGATYWLVIRNTGDSFTYRNGMGVQAVGTSPGRVHSDTPSDVDPDTWDAKIPKGRIGVKINADAVPEPSTAGLGLLACLVFFRRKRI
ncbi:MAG: hypothetical protein EOP87_01695 [Verrucomicrobiaceae bacterium]|nr:MAG: hypothetical protein EOP87_01695 [Verrucomicrobiaceae bacterium]